MPRVSLILPNYNYARYLDERIVSLLKQTYRDFELLILDDASTDNSCEVIKKYTYDPRVRTNLHTQNSGQVYKRWNEGVEETTGEYILIAGADDSCHPTMLEKLVDKMEANPRMGMAFCHSLVLSGNSRVEYSTRQWAIDHHVEHWLADHDAHGREECTHLLRGNEVIPNASGVLIRRAAFVQAGGFDLSLPLAADYLLWGQLMLHWDIGFVAAPLNYWRYHDKTVTAKTIKNQRDASDIEELYRVVLHLATELGGAENREIASEAMAKRWVDRVAEARMRIPFWRNRRIYGIARQLDTRLKRRLLRLGGGQLWRKLRSG